MKEIFVGTLAGGFGIKSVVEDEAAEAVVVACLANGQLAEALDVDDPLDMDKHAEVDEAGLHFIVYGKGLGNGFTVYGPFADNEIAMEFGEENRGEDEEWELFEVNEQPSNG